MNTDNNEYNNALESYLDANKAYEAEYAKVEKKNAPLISQISEIDAEIKEKEELIQLEEQKCRDYEIEKENAENEYLNKIVVHLKERIHLERIKKSPQSVVQDSKTEEMLDRRNSITKEKKILISQSKNKIAELQGIVEQLIEQKSKLYKKIDSNKKVLSVLQSARDNATNRFVLVDSSYHSYDSSDFIYSPDINDSYDYERKQVEEMRNQTEEARKQTEEARKQTKLMQEQARKEKWDEHWAKREERNNKRKQEREALMKCQHCVNSAKCSITAKYNSLTCGGYRPR